jgi:hypothetical protein
MCKKSNALFFCGLMFVLFGLVGALIPLSDLDHDGCLESLATAGFLSPPILSFSIALFTLLILIPANHLLASQNFFAPLIPPPIPTK